MDKENFIKFTLQTDTDGTGELFAEFCANGFTGIGSAWFDLSELLEFSEKLQEYPLPQDRQVAIAGGYWSSDTRGKLEQIHLSLKLYSISRTGLLGAKIQVATPIGEFDRPESCSSAEAEIQTNYNELEKFAKQLKKLVNSEIDHAFLRGEA